MRADAHDRRVYELALKFGQESYEGKKIPVLIGEGIPLVQPRHRAVSLILESTRSYPDGVVRLHYAVRR